MMDLQDRWRHELGEQIVPQTFTEDAGPTLVGVKPQLTDAEARAAAKLMIKMRREELRRKLKEAEQVAEPQETQEPALRVIEGT